tara:strand:+ start:1534 stop:1791 length:258 start_codon:yes stop_codon:yes gene_type:complete
MGHETDTAFIAYRRRLVTQSRLAKNQIAARICAVSVCKTPGQDNGCFKAAMAVHRGTLARFKLHEFRARRTGRGIVNAGQATPPL